jgi:hypothetical protein
LFPNWESSIHESVRIIEKRTLRLFWESNREYADAKRALEDWHAQVSQADWATPASVEQRGLSRRDLEALLGGRSRVSEILNRKRPLTINMIRRLHKELGIPAESLIQPTTDKPQSRSLHRRAA